MKKLVILSLLSVALLSSCGNGAKNEAMKAQNDSLMVELSSRNAELDEIMGAFNEVQEGFRQINEAENRVDLQSGSIRENSKYNSAQLKKAIANLTKELEAKQQQIETLQAELASKNIRIAELDDAVAGLSQNVSDLTAENEAKSATVASQDKALNTAWFVFGTKSELKDQKILKNGDVLKNDDFNKDYFTQIDIRTDKEIKLYSKRAELLTTHPAGSYELVKDAKGQLTLKITNPSQFWSVSRYLVIQVK